MRPPDAVIRAGDVIREDAGQHDLDPPPPSLQVQAGGGFAQIARGRPLGAGNDVEQDVPLRAQDHQRAEPRYSH